MLDDAGVHGACVIFVCVCVCVVCVVVHARHVLDDAGLHGACVSTAACYYS